MPWFVWSRSRFCRTTTPDGFLNLLYSLSHIPQMPSLFKTNRFCTSSNRSSDIIHSHVIVILDKLFLHRSTANRILSHNAGAICHSSISLGNSPASKTEGFISAILRFCSFFSGSSMYNMLAAICAAVLVFPHHLARLLQIDVNTPPD